MAHIGTFVFEFPEIEDLITGEKYREITPIGVNQMYANAREKPQKESSGVKFDWGDAGLISSNSKKNSRKGRRLTREAVKYKAKITSDLMNQKALFWIKDILEEDEIFYTVNINLVVPETKLWELNKSYLKDLDNLIKGLQDCLTGIIFKDDNQVRSFFPTLTYNADPMTKITLALYTFDQEKHEIIQSFIEQLLGN